MRNPPNRLIASLSKRDQHALVEQCQTTQLRVDSKFDRSVGTSSMVYFLTGASIALLVANSRGVNTAVGLVGFEGAVGLQYALGFKTGVYELLVQTPGTALTLDGSSLNRLMKSRPAIHLAVSRYLWMVAEEQARFAVAIQSQTVPQRLAGWILQSQSPRSAEPMMLTQEHIANMLGVRRSSVCLAAVELRGLGLIEYNRGRVQVLDAVGLLAVTRG